MIGGLSAPKSDHRRTPGQKSLVLLSGGLDSATLAFLLGKQGHAIECLYFDYEQRGINAERDCAMTVASELGVSLNILEMPRPRDFLRSIVPSPNDDIELFADVVNLCTMAATFAVEVGADSVLLGINADDTRVHPTLQTVFFRNIQRLASLWIDKDLKLLTPFLHKDKLSVMRVGMKLGVPFGSTWSCNANVDKHCGRCSHCLDRRAAFSLLGLADPTQYEYEVCGREQ
jgi:7-cyano-7-deazaguanine synthase